MMEAFIEWWNETHDWEFNPLCEDMYETHALKFFKAGWEKRKEKDEQRSSMASQER